MTRDYVKSHPWLKFDLDLDRANAHFWMLLGEARSKCDHIRFVPLERATAEELQRVYFAKGIAATTAIEGNTLSEEQVLDRISGQLELPISQEYMGVEIDNMISAYNDIIEGAMSGHPIIVDAHTLAMLNKQILDGTNHESEAVPGKTREHDVRAGSYLAAPWTDINYLVDRLCEWLDGPAFRPQTEADRIPFAFIKAVVAHLYIEWIHPFGDGNGRLGRLVEFMVLVSCGVPVPAAHILTSHYNETRPEYYRQLAGASRRDFSLRPFLQYAAQGWVDGLFAAIKQLHKQQERLMWRAIVDDRLEDRHTAAAHRQRLLLHALGQVDGWTTRRNIPVLTPELARSYAGKTTKTITRDINALYAMGMLRTRPGRTEIRANFALVRGMRPFFLADVENDGD